MKREGYEPPTPVATPETTLERIADGDGPDSTDTNLRYAAYATRIRTILNSGHRYLAYSSDIGESFRPVSHPWLVRSAYGISWLYLIGDVGYEGYKTYKHNQDNLLGPRDPTTTTTTTPTDAVSAAIARTEKTVAPHVPAIQDYRAVMAQRAVFQTVASMALPTLTVHSVVKYSGRYLQNVKNVRVRTWGPIGLGLAVVPALPYMFDEPTEHAVEWLFHRGFEYFGGPEAVGHAHASGHVQEEAEKAAARAKKEL